MAKLLKMHICGIRNFNPNEEKKVKFGTPVTLIVGQNGSGKTTIIESLKFGLTGELPTNSKNGQGFVNDPKMTNKQLIKGSVKVNFNDVKGNDVIMARFVQVQQKAQNVLQFKSLMPSVRLTPIDDPNNAQDLSGRCADLNVMCGQFLNVSPSIVNNVLLCHQENASWPLDEPKKLKEKFDEIFDSVRYDKCSIELRSIMRQKAIDIKVLKQEINTKKELNNHVVKQKRRLDERRNSLATLKQDIDGKQLEIVPIDRRIDEIIQLEQELGQLQMDLRGKEEAKKNLQENQATIRANIATLFNGSDEDLNNEIVTFKKRADDVNDLINKLESRQQEMSKKITEIGESIQSYNENIGKFQQQLNQYKEKCLKFDELINSARTEFNLDNVQLEGPIHSSNYLNHFTEALNQQEIEFKEFLAVTELETNELQKMVDQKRDEHVKIGQQIHFKSTQINDIQQKLHTIRKRQDEIRGAEIQRQNIEQKLKENEQNLLRVKNGFNENEKQKEMERLNDQINDLERNLDKLDQDYKILQQNHVAEERIESENDDICEKQLLQAEIKQKHAEHFKILGIKDGNYQNSVKEAQQIEEQRFKSTSNDLSRLQREIIALETTINHENEKIESLEDKLNANESKIVNLTNGKLFTDVLNATIQNRERLQKNRGQYSSAKTMYETFIEEFRTTKPCCPICLTNFNNKRQTDEIVQRLYNKITTIPQQLQQIEVDLVKEEELYTKLQEVKPTNEEIERIRKDLPKMKLELNKKRGQLKSLQENQQHIQNQCEKHENLLNICKIVVSDATLLDQYVSDVEKSQLKINELKEQIVEVYSKQTRHEVEEQIERFKSQCNLLKTQRENLLKSFDSFRTRLEKLSNEKQQLTDKHNPLLSNAREMPQLEKSMQEYNESLQQIEEELKNLKRKLNDAENELKQSEHLKEQQIKQMKIREQNQRESLETKKNLIDKLVTLQISIKDDLSNNIEAKLAKQNEELQKLLASSQKLEITQKTVREAICEKKEQLAKSEIQYRDLNDNLMLRNKQKEEHSLDIEIAELKRKVGNCNYRSVYDEKQRLMSKRSELMQNVDGFKGQLKEIETTIKDIEFELSRNEYKDAYKNYMRKIYELKVTEKIEEDLWQYTQVLEASLIQFHKERMIQINRLIRELWRSIYRGNDIDYIEIQTENAGVNRTKTRRNFNYKVVQVNKGVEMDMRGRCSAGQRVLACLVIRIALAETFSSHCGILALDEPTTNLDQENITSLSETLSNLIQMKKDHKNFQMIIITHDEEFLQILTRNLSVEHFWRVSRDPNGFSLVEKEKF